MLDKIINPINISYSLTIFPHQNYYLLFLSLPPSSSLLCHCGCDGAFPGSRAAQFESHGSRLVLDALPRRHGRPEGDPGLAQLQTDVLEASSHTSTFSLSLVEHHGVVVFHLPLKVLDVARKQRFLVKRRHQRLRESRQLGRSQVRAVRSLVEVFLRVWLDQALDVFEFFSVERRVRSRRRRPSPLPVQVGKVRNRPRLPSLSLLNPQLLVVFA